MQKHLQHKACGARRALAWALFGIAAGRRASESVPTDASADPGSVHRKSAAVEAKRAELKGDATSTKFLLGLSAGVRAEIFTLANPYRVVVDLPDVAFHLPDGTGQKGRGLVSAFRYGLLAEGKARVVIDTTGPVVIKRADMSGQGRQRRRAGDRARADVGAVVRQRHGRGAYRRRAAPRPSRHQPPSR